MSAKPGWDEARAQQIVESASGADGATLPILHALQDAFGYVDPSATAVIAKALNLSIAEVHGVISFYHDFRSAPAGRRVIKVCRAEACQANGCEEMIAELSARHGAAPGETDNDRLTIETVYCLGNCALGPNALVDGELVGRLDAERLAALCNGTPVGELQADVGVVP